MTKEVRLEIFNYLFLIRMKLKDNALSHIKQMIDNPEKDWSNDLPIIEFTEKDFAFSQSIIKRRINDPDRRKVALEWLEQFKEQWRSNHHWENQHSDFYSRLEALLSFRKRWTTTTIIRQELQEQFPYIGEWGYSNHLHDKVHRIFSLQETLREYEKQLNDHIAECKQLNLEEEISKLRELDLEIGEGN